MWLQYSRADEADPITYAVIGKDGAMLRTVTVPAGVGITSVSSQYAYGALKTGETRELVRLAIPYATPTSTVPPPRSMTTLPVCSPRASRWNASMARSNGTTWSTCGQSSPSPARRTISR